MVYEPVDTTGWIKTTSLPVYLGDEPFLQPLLDRQVSLTLTGRSVNDIRLHIIDQTGIDPDNEAGMNEIGFKYTLSFQASLFEFLQYVGTLG